MKPSPHPYSGPERPAPGLPARPGRRGFLGGLLATAAVAAAGPAPGDRAGIVWPLRSALAGL
ncbi:hypothetical protein ACWDMY_33755, partial [Streptomyces globisporus]